MISDFGVAVAFPGTWTHGRAFLDSFRSTTDRSSTLRRATNPTPEKRNKMPLNSDQIETPLHSVVRPGFGDAVSLQAWQSSCLAAVEHQLVPYAVAPQCGVPTPRGRIAAGGEVSLRDFGGNAATLDVLVARGVVLKASAETIAAARCPANARYRVAPGGSVSTRHGIAAAGAQVHDGDFVGGDDALQDLVRRGAVVDTGAAK